MIDTYRDSYLEGVEKSTNEYRVDQLDMMRKWFYLHFEDPAERTPYESREGGFIWIWGGPFDAREELQNKFYDTVPEEIIEELVEELNCDCLEWAPTSKLDDYEDYFIEDITKNTEFYSNFKYAILNVIELLTTNVAVDVLNCLYRILYVNVITALETYLSDAFIHTVVPNQDLMRRFIETTPEFQNEKIAVSDIFKEIEKIDQKAKKYLADIVWHNLNRIKPMYKDTLGISFPKEINAIYKAIHKRHDIVHRNGKSKSGDEIIINQNEVYELIFLTETLVESIDAQLAGFNRD